MCDDCSKCPFQGNVSALSRPLAVTVSAVRPGCSTSTNQSEYKSFNSEVRSEVGKRPVVGSEGDCGVQTPRELTAAGARDWHNSLTPAPLTWRGRKTTDGRARWGQVGAEGRQDAAAVVCHECPRAPRDRCR